MIDLAPYSLEKAECLERLQSLQAEARALELEADGVRLASELDREACGATFYSRVDVGNRNWSAHTSGNFRQSVPYIDADVHSDWAAFAGSRAKL
jgi:hypothetical protein